MSYLNYTELRKQIVRELGDLEFLQMKKKLGRVVITKKGKVVKDKAFWGSIWKSDRDDSVWKSIYFIIDTDIYSDFIEENIDILDNNNLRFKAKYNEGTWYMEDSYRISLARTGDIDMQEVLDLLNKSENSRGDWKVEIILNKKWEDVQNEYIMRNL